MSLSRKIVQIFENPAEVAKGALKFCVDRLSPQRTSPYWLSLAGGTTPKELYRLLAQQELPWEHLHLIWGDERFVPPDHADSNFRMVREAWLDLVPGLSERAHPWPILDSPEESAQRYDQWVLQHCPEGPDLCLLGMGDDGHTASLFPGTAALEEQGKRAVANWVEKFEAHRLTLTYPFLNRSQEILFLITGANKAAPLREVLEQNLHPTARIQAQKATYYFVDRAAAGQL